MMKDDVVRAMAKKGGVTLVEAKRNVELFLNVIADALADGESIIFREFGKFYVTERKAARCHDFRSGETIEVPAHKVPRFKAGKQLKAAVR